MLEIKTIEDRLKFKADKIGLDRAIKVFNNLGELSDAFKLVKDSFSEGSVKRKIANLSGWEVAEVCRAALTKLYQQQALEELRTELIDMHDRLSEITQEQ